MSPAQDFLDFDLRGLAGRAMPEAGYADLRRADPRIAAQLHAALGSARTVLNVGAGAGNYEPVDRYVLALEPSAAMRAQRPPHLVPAIAAPAERIPLGDKCVDAAMASMTVHQWSDLTLGLREMRRVTRGPIVILTFDPDRLDRFWLYRYAPELLELERRRCPSIETLCNTLGGRSEVRYIAVPIDCLDGFSEAFYARPERFLDSSVRRAQSSWSFVEPDVHERVVETLRAELASGEWDRRFGNWRRFPQFDGSLCLIVNTPAAS
jgi:SAM-dependent methyltransferase